MNVIRRRFVSEGFKQVMCVGYQSNELCRKRIQQAPSHRSGVTATLVVVNQPPKRTQGEWHQTSKSRVE